MINVLKELREINDARNVVHFPSCEHWSESDWGNAIAGETGEMCNKIKKRKLGKPVLIAEVGDEMADIIIYLDLLATKMGINLEASIVRKFNEKSRELGSNIMFKGDL